MTTPGLDAQPPHGYWQTEEGLPLVLLHGFCEDSSVWEAMRPHWQGLPLLSVDLPGFGASKVPEHPSVAHYAEGVAALMASLSIKKALVVGHSLGGYVALELAARFPERLAGLCLLHSHPYEDTPERKEGRRRAIELLQGGKKEMYLNQLYPGLFAPAFLMTHPEVLEKLLEKGKAYAPEGIIAALNAMIHRREHLDTLHNAAMPVQFVLGDQDALIPIQQALKAAVLPAVSRIDLLNGVGHMSMFEAPELAAGLVREFYNYIKNI